MSDFFSLLCQNMILMTALTSWLIAQTLKTITNYWKNKELDFTRLVGAGGMPSSHTALVVSLATSAGLQDGFQSPTFALAFVLAAIVMYDAAGVRRAAGKQARILNKLLMELKDEHTIRENRLKELLGHTPLEVLAGALLGILMAWLFRWLYSF